MNDPHVEALVYRVEHGPNVDYDKAEPLEHDTQTFSVRIEDGQARFDMKEHFDTEEAAREAIEPFIQSWELSVGLKDGPDRFALVFDRSEIIDRNPPSGVNIYAPVGRFVLQGFDAEVRLSHYNYPEPPYGLAVNPDVTSMHTRYLGYRRGNEPLATMAHFCLTVLEESTGRTTRRRQLAAKKFRISSKVLNKLAYFTSEKGGVEARKAGGIRKEFTVQERQWIEATIKGMIRRAAEVAYDPNQALQQITFADFPPLDKPDEGRS